MLLSTLDFSEKLIAAIKTSKSSVLVASAFIKTEALKKLLAIESNIEVVIISRWQKPDLISGASDVEVYELCQANGWKFGVCQNFHGKVYLVDQQNIFLGSANLTQRGLNLTSFSNIEFGTVIPANKFDLQKIERFLDSEIIWLDEIKFAAIKHDLETAKESKQPLSSMAWSDDVKNLLNSNVQYLWVQELVFKSPDELLHLDLNDDYHLHDYDLLNLNLDVFSPESLKSSFKRSRLYYWVIFQLNEHTEMNFGGLTHALHNALLDDPLPYRTEIKEFIAILFSWFEFLDDEFIVTKHQRTSSVKHSNRALDNA